MNIKQLEAAVTAMDQMEVPEDSKMILSWDQYTTILIEHYKSAHEKINLNYSIPLRPFLNLLKGGVVLSVNVQ